MTLLQITTPILLAGVLSTAQAATLTSGHVDAIAVGYHDGDLEPHVHAAGATINGVPNVSGEFESGDIVFIVPQSTADYIALNGGRLAGSQWDPIGVAAGAGFWFLPQSGSLSSTLGAPYAGIATEELDPADWSSPILITLTSAQMPLAAQFALGRTDTVGTPTFFMATFDGISAADSLEIPAGVHRHYDWYFTAPGTYELTFDFAGTHAVDGPKSASATYTFEVIPEPSAALLGALGALGLLRRRR